MFASRGGASDAGAAGASDVSDDAGAAVDAVYATKFADAAKAAKTAAKRFPHLPGLDAATCDLDLRQEQLGSAKKKCAAVIVGVAQNASSQPTYSG